MRWCGSIENSRMLLPLNVWIEISADSIWLPSVEAEQQQEMEALLARPSGGDSGAPVTPAASHGRLPSARAEPPRLAPLHEAGLPGGAHCMPPQQCEQPTLHASAPATAAAVCAG